MASQLLCCMIQKSDDNQSNIQNPYPFHPSWRRRYFAAWSPHNQNSINQTYAILTHFIHHGVADDLLHDLHTIRNQNNKPYPFHPSWCRRCFAAWSPHNQKSINQTCVIVTHFIHHGVADALLHGLHKIRNQSIQPTSSLAILSIMAKQMLCWIIEKTSKINQSTLHYPYPFHPSWRRRCFAAWSRRCPWHPALLPPRAAPSWRALQSVGSGSPAVCTHRSSFVGPDPELFTLADPN